MQPRLLLCYDYGILYAYMCKLRAALLYTLSWSCDASVCRRN